MALNMKERFARLDMSKLPKDYQDQFMIVKETTKDFSVEELNNVFEENFNEIYGLVESKYPDAIKKGEKIKKEKPAKVKVLKSKKEKKEEKKYELPGKIEKELKGRLSEEDIIFIEDQLTNNEASSDEELVEHFMKETGMTEAKAKKWVALRDKYLKATVDKNYDYPTRTSMKKAARKEKDVVTTRDGFEFNRKDPKNRGKVFYDEKGEKWTCKRYEPKLDECIMVNEDGKEISCCMKDMYKNNPVKKREKGNLVDECKDTLKEAGYTVKEHKAGKKVVKRKAPRPEKEIIKDRVEDTFTPIRKDLENSDEKKVENKDVLDSLNRIQGLFTKLLNRLSNLADDGKADKIKQIEKLLSELLDE